MPGHGWGGLLRGRMAGVISVTGVMCVLRLVLVMLVTGMVRLVRVTGLMRGVMSLVCVMYVVRLLCRGSPHRVGRHCLRGGITSRLMRVMMLMPGTMMPVVPVVGMMGVLHVPGRVGTGQHPRHRGCKRGHQEQPEHGS